MICGDCVACCTFTKVPELNKAAGHKCKHCDAGCTIYDSRPVSCRLYKCEYLKGNYDIRPDKAGFILERLPDAPVIAVIKTDNSAITNEMTTSFKQFTDSGIAMFAKGQALLPENMDVNEFEYHVNKAVKEIGIVRE